MKADAAPHASRCVDVSIITDMTTHSQRLQLMLWRALGILVGVSTVTHGLSMTRRLIVRKLGAMSSSDMSAALDGSSSIVMSATRRIDPAGSGFCACLVSVSWCVLVWGGVSFLPGGPGGPPDGACGQALVLVPEFGRDSSFGVAFEHGPVEDDVVVEVGFQ